MEAFCDCDKHGACGEYNSSRFTESEILYHKEWDELYDSSVGEFRKNVSICYCDAGWTGYSDLGTFQVEVLQNCVIHEEAMTVLWAVSSICYAVLVISMIQRGLEQREVDKGIRAKSRLAVRFVALVAFCGIALVKYMFTNKPWFVTMGISPGMTVAYLSGMLFFMFDITETQHKHVQRYYSKMFKDFGFGDRVKVEQVELVTSLRIQQACIAFSVMFLGIAVLRGSKITRTVAVVVYFGAFLIVLLADVLIVDPKTNARFLVILKRMMDLNTADSQYQPGKQLTSSQSQDLSRGKVRSNSANVAANQRLQEVYAKVAMMNRTKRIQTLCFVLLCIPFYNRNWWKFLGYNIVLSTIVHSFAKTIIYFLSLRHRARKKIQTKSQCKNQRDSSEVSAFHSTAVSVAPLAIKTQTVQRT